MAATDLPYRPSCRALIVDADDRVLLARHDFREGTVWAAPGGRIEEGESLREALARELHEEVGLDLGSESPEIRPVWQQRIDFADMAPSGWAGVENHVFLLRTEGFDPVAGVAPGEDGHPYDEGILDIRWWTPVELAAAGADQLFSPRALPALLPELLAQDRVGTLPEEPRRLGL